MLTKNTEQLLIEKMCVDIDTITSKVETPELSEFKEDVINFINSATEVFAVATSINDFNNLYHKYSYLHDNIMVNEVVDSIRHAYISFWEGGLLDLFTYQENEGWYPKIILKAKLEPNDIESLPDPLTIYRGCSSREFDEKKFGQSWSTSLEIAESFAFSHYQGQSWFNIEERIVLKATIEKKDIFFSKQLGEFEVVVDSKMLKNIKKIT
jgi:hypothetical protein